MLDPVKLSDDVFKEAQQQAGTWSHIFIREVIFTLRKNKPSLAQDFSKALVDKITESKPSELIVFKIAQLLSTVRQEEFQGYEEFLLSISDQLNTILIGMKSGPLCEPTKRLFFALTHPLPKVQKTHTIHLRSISSSPMNIIQNVRPKLSTPKP